MMIVVTNSSFFLLIFLLKICFPQTKQSILRCGEFVDAKLTDRHVNFYSSQRATDHFFLRRKILVVIES